MFGRRGLPSIHPGIGNVIGIDTNKVFDYNHRLLRDGVADGSLSTAARRWPFLGRSRHADYGAKG